MQGLKVFLGWLALQPRFHRMELTQLIGDEINALGKNIQNIDTALRQYWSIKFPDDPIQRVYVVYFFESEGYHLHIHLIPRSEKLGCEDPEEYMAWKTFERTKKDRFPQEYRIMMKDQCENWVKDKKVVALMTYLKGYLWKISTK
jgi:diadenosine tetraphosphate (Ap4A) HIT family hydrolase